VKSNKIGFSPSIFVMLGIAITSYRLKGRAVHKCGQERCVIARITAHPAAKGTRVPSRTQQLIPQAEMKAPTCHPGERKG